jgi:hypothetical protein
MGQKFIGLSNNLKDINLENSFPYLQKLGFQVLG